MSWQGQNADGSDGSWKCRSDRFSSHWVHLFRCLFHMWNLQFESLPNSIYISPCRSLNIIADRLTNSVRTWLHAPISHNNTDTCLILDAASFGSCGVHDWSMFLLYHMNAVGANILPGTLSQSWASLLCFNCTVFNLTQQFSRDICNVSSMQPLTELNMIKASYGFVSFMYIITTNRR